MTSQVLRYALIECDHCGKAFGNPGQFVEVVEARKGARAAGWKLVGRMKKNGRRTRVDLADDELGAVASRVAQDVCSPQCAEAISPAEYKASAGRSMWWQDRIAQLQAENEQLRRTR